MNIYLKLIILLNGLLWAKSSYGKFVSGNFVDNLGKTLTAFASKNPYPWYKDFLNNVAIPNSQIFGTLTLYGEAFAALTLTFIPLYLFFKPANQILRLLLILGLLTGAFLNLIFWLAAGWTSPSTDSLNLVMLGVQVIALFAILKHSKK